MAVRLAHISDCVLRLHQDRIGVNEYFPKKIIFLFCRILIGPVDEIKLVFFNGYSVFTHGFLLHAYSSIMNGFHGSGYKWVPSWQRLPLFQQAVCAGGWQPGILANRIWGQLDAIRHGVKSIFIIRTTTCVVVQQCASNVGEVDFSCVPVFQLIQATSAASITQRLPFFPIHLGQRLLLPKWLLMGICRNGGI